MHLKGFGENYLKTIKKASDFKLSTNKQSKKLNKKN
jgi:hypothetical protein